MPVSIPGTNTSVTRGFKSHLLAGTVPCVPRSTAEAPRARTVVPGLRALSPSGATVVAEAAFVSAMLIAGSDNNCSSGHRRSKVISAGGGHSTHSQGRIL